MEHDGFVSEWHRLVEARDIPGLSALFRDDVVLRSPVLHRPTEGLVGVGLVLSHVIEVLDPLTYVGRFDNEDGVVLRFAATVTDDDGRVLDVDGIDLFSLDPDGRVRELTVMVRPLSALQALAARMRERLLEPAG